jgi:phosphatidylserine decarboxylase
MTRYFYKKNLFFYDRKEKCLKKEKIYGGLSLRILHSFFLRKIVLPLFIKPFSSKVYGWYKKQNFTQRSVQKFIKKYAIKIEEYKKGTHKKYPYYKNFAEFFIREFKEGKRQFKGTFSAFAEARYLFYPFLTQKELYPVKSYEIDPLKILPEHISEYFTQGSFIIARLAPVDYHRFHFPCDGKVLDVVKQSGLLYSVNTLALEKNPKSFMLNQRTTYLLETQFGKIAYTAVGAICVGEIEFFKKEGDTFKQGEQAGLFQFGGSTVLLYSEHPLPFALDLLQQQHEIFITLGQNLLL